MKAPTSIPALLLLIVPVFLFMVLKITYIVKQIYDGKREGRCIREIFRDGSDLTTGSIILDASILLIVILLGFFGIKAILDGMHIK